VLRAASFFILVVLDSFCVACLEAPPVGDLGVSLEVEVFWFYGLSRWTGVA